MTFLDEPSLNEAPDDTLLLATARGDRRAFQVLMARHIKSSLALAQRVLGNPDDADEVVQEAFLRVWRAAPRWRTDGTARVTTWLYRIVMNLCLDRKRKGPAALPLDDSLEIADSQPDGLEATTAAHTQTLVAEALNDLTPQQRAAIVLYYFEEVSAPEAARIMTVSPSALESLLVRGRRALKRSLARRGILAVHDMI